MKTSRRDFLTTMIKTGGALSIVGLPLVMLAKQSRADNDYTLRPPGAINEHDFLSACSRCGLCVRACPYDTLKLSFGDNTTNGTPYFTPRDIPCEMCEELYCIKACPTGALDQSITDVNTINMGTAVLVDEENCLAFLGLRCEVCFRVCPLMDKAITLELSENQRTHEHANFIPKVHAEYCTGCGICEEKCILEHASAIKVLPNHIARTKLPKHYQKSWEKNSHLDQKESEKNDILEENAPFYDLNNLKKDSI